jgi:large subunit ribosomal protein L25
MERVQLEVRTRETVGKGPGRQLRETGRIPGIVYGIGVDTTAIDVEARQLERIVAAGANALIDLKGPKSVKGRLVLIKELQRHSVSRKLLHCDFYAVDTKQEIHVEVPLHFVGKPPGVEQGGHLETLLREIEVACLPLSIPDSIDVPVDTLMIGDSVRASELHFPEGVRSLVDPEVSVVQVGAPRIEEEPTPAEAEEPEEAPEGEDEGKGEGKGKGEPTEASEPGA